MELLLASIFVVNEGIKLDQLKEAYNQALISVIVGAVFVVLYVVVVILAWVGLCTEKAALLIPHLVCQVLHMICLAAAAIVAIVFLVLYVTGNETSKFPLILNTGERKGLNTIQGLMRDRGVPFFFLLYNHMI